MDSKFTLREWKLSDKESLAENANNIKIWNNVRDSFPFPYTIEDGEQFIKMVAAKPKPLTDLTIEINGKAVGGIGIVLNPDVERIAAEIGYWLGENYWNRGIMTNVVKEMVGYSFSHFSIRKLYAPVFEFNTASQRVLEKAGFEKEAVLKQSAIKNNVVIDLHYYVLIKT
ncbi:MAG: GNAT family N-acetyltransferase [Bacteroidales bacterium]|jgi:RimJ/RimL family protein N-acetyltransferase|nr:GNAT family N-acetyltransferase [Bacteroidales bacterium]